MATVTFYVNHAESELDTTPAADLLKAAREERIECPQCGTCTPLSTNGCTSKSTLSFCCDVCGEQFDADSLAVKS